MDIPAEFQRLGADVLRQEHPKAVTEMTAIKKGNASALKAIATSYRRMDDALLRAPEAIDCGGQCNYCCFYHVYVTPIEVFALVEYMEKHFDASRKQQVSEQLATNLAQIDGLTAEEHIATNVRCPLLSVEGRCDAYEVRPAACRRHHAIDRTSCEVTFHNTSSPMKNLQSPFRITVSNGFVASGVLAASAVGMDATGYEMNSALHEAMTNKACIKRWRDGKIAFPTVKDRQQLG